MLNSILILITVMSFGIVAFAQEAAPAPEVVPVATDIRLRIDEARNYIQVGGLISSSSATDDDDSSTIENSDSGSGVIIRYFYRVSDQLLIGAGYSGTNGKSGDEDDRDCKGDLATGQCIAMTGKTKSQNFEISTLYYFRDQGFRKWGFYINPSVGVTKMTVDGNF